MKQLKSALAALLLVSMSMTTFGCAPQEESRHTAEGSGITTEESSREDEQSESDESSASKEDSGSDEASVPDEDSRRDEEESSRHSEESSRLPVSFTADDLVAKIAEDERLTGELENKTIKWMANWDLNPAYPGETTDIELSVFQSRYGGEIEYYSVDWSSRYDSLATAINGGEGIDFFPASDLDAFPKGAFQDMFIPIDDYIDFSSELWTDTKEVMDQFVWGDKHYVIVNAVYGDNCVLIYNKTTIEENGLTDPYELFAKGEWNWNTFQEQLEQFVDVENGYYGLDGYWFELGLSGTLGVPYIGMEDGKLVNNLKHPDIKRLQNWFLELANNDLLAIGVGDFGWAEKPEYIGEGKELYFPAGLWKLYTTPDQWEPVFGNAEDVMFVPMPRDPESDAYYIPCSLDGYAMVKNGDNPEGVVKFTECKRATLLHEYTGLLDEEQLYSEYGWSEDMVEMKQILDRLAQANPHYDFYTGVSAEVTTTLDSSENGICSTTKRQVQWSETVDAIYDAIQTYVNEYNSLQ